MRALGRVECRHRAMIPCSAIGPLFLATAVALAGSVGIAGCAVAAEISERPAAGNLLLEKDAPIRAPKSWLATVTARRLNVRSGPGEGYSVVETLEQGATVSAIAKSGDWIRLDRAGEAWVARGFLKLPDDFMRPLFREADNAFLDWAAATGNFEELSVESDGRLSVIMTRTLYADPVRLEKVARDTACAYRDSAAHRGDVQVTVWAADGPAAGLVRQVRCP